MTEDIEEGKIGSSFEDFLKEQGAYAETTQRAEKCVRDFQLTRPRRQ